MQIPFELEALSNAREYQKWMYQSIEPYLGKSILELGSGIGNMSQWLPIREKLILSDVEKEFIQILKNKPKFNDPRIQFLEQDLSKTLNSQLSDAELDTVVSFNVLEHIEDDLKAVREQLEVLKYSKSKAPKRLIIVVPANQFAYGSLDRVFQHYRRYSRKMMLDLIRKADPTLKPSVHYFNLLSLPGWYVQGKIFKTTTIKSSQVKLLEKIIPFWKPIDHFLNEVLRIGLGQSIVCVVDVPTANT